MKNAYHEKTVHGSQKLFAQKYTYALTLFPTNALKSLGVGAAFFCEGPGGAAAAHPIQAGISPFSLQPRGIGPSKTEQTYYLCRQKDGSGGKCHYASKLHSEIHEI